MPIIEILGSLIEIVKRIGIYILKPIYYRLIALPALFSHSSKAPMLIDDLISVLPLPANPFESTASNDWGMVTNRYGVPLPGDFMQYIDKYGSGCINEQITVFNPFSKNPHLNLMDQTFVQLANLRSLRSSSPECLPYPLFFEPDGLLPWGTSGNGDIFCWQTSGMSGRWQVVVVTRDGESELFKLTMVEFLIKLIKGEIRSAWVPEEFALTLRAKFKSFENLT